MAFHTKNLAFKKLTKSGIFSETVPDIFSDIFSDIFLASVSSLSDYIEGGEQGGSSVPSMLICLSM